MDPHWFGSLSDKLFTSVDNTSVDNTSDKLSLLSSLTGINIIICVKKYSGFKSIMFANCTLIIRRPKWCGSGFETLLTLLM
jgi:hypothetical protein